MNLIAALEQLGDHEAARAAAAALLRLSPNVTVTAEYERKRPVHKLQDYVARFADGLRKAGVPE